MRTRILLFTLIIGAFPFHIDAQTDWQSLFFLSTSLGREYAGARLYRVDVAKGTTPRFVREVANAWHTVLADYDLGKLVVARTIVPHDLAVVDMASPNLERSVPVDYCGLGDSNCSPAAAKVPHGIYLLADELGLFIAMPLERMWEPDHPQPATSLLTVRLGDAVAQVVSLPLEELAYIRLSGAVGLSGPTVEMPVVHGNPLEIYVDQPKGVATNLPRPPYAQPSEKSFRLAARTNSIAVLKPFQPFQSNVVDIFDQALGTWRRVELPFTTCRIRAFGLWIAAIAS